jgi:hypothetical protein
MFWPLLSRQIFSRAGTLGLMSVPGVGGWVGEGGGVGWGGLCT